MEENRLEEITEGVKEKAEWLVKWQKTDALIRMLAREDHLWTQEDIRRAVGETGTFEFSLGDIQYIRKLNESGIYKEYAERAEYLTKYLPLVKDERQRVKFYRKEIVPLVTYRKILENHEKLQLGNQLKFYKEMEEEYAGREN